jgi:5'-nucleotidase
MTRRVSAAIFLALLLSACLALPQGSTTLVVLHTGDMHGQLLSRNGVGGLAALGTVVRREKPDLLLDGGDMFTGTMANDEFFGKPMIDVMNHLGYAAAALGNHEFDYGLPELRKRLQEARFPVLSANVKGIDEVRPFTVVTAKGVRVGIIGLTVENLAQVTQPRNLKTITVTNVVDAVRDTLPRVRPLSDFIVVVSHADMAEQIRVAKAFPEVRLIVAGHEHAERTTREGGTWIVEAGSNVRAVGKVTIQLRGKVPTTITPETIPLRSIPPDPEAQSLIAPYEKAVAQRAAERVGEAEADLRKSDSEESPLHNLIADALRDAAGTQFAFHNLGGIRAPLQRGVITRGDIFDILPFRDALVKMTLTGAQIRQLLGRRVLAVSGLRVVWDTTRPRPNQLVAVTLANRQPLQDAARYTVVVNDFLASGGDGMLEFTRGESVEDTGILLRDAVVSYLKKRPVVTAATDGRVSIRTQ